MPITNRTEFGQYCLRKLGAPVININVASEQVVDRIDEAIDVWREKHFDATEKLWVAYAITAEDITKGYITLPEDIHIVDKMLPASVFYRSNGDGVFGFQYQFMMNNLSPFQPLDMINYQMTMQNINEVNDMVNTTEQFEFTKHMRKLHVYNGFNRMTVGEVLCFHVHKYLAEDTHMFNDKWLKLYSTALIKQQWGSNMKKHSEIQLLGGVTINGQTLFDEATTELEKLEERLAEEYQEPTRFFMG